MNCPRCYASNVGGAAFCAGCGGSLAPPPSFCSKCGASVAVGAAFCNGCGRDMAVPFVPAAPMMPMGAPMHPPIVAMVAMGGCPRCGSPITEGYQTVYIVLAVVFFPLGLLFLLSGKERRCLNAHCRLVF